MRNDLIAFAGDLPALLSSLGAWSVEAIWLPVLLWTAAALIVELLLRLPAPPLLQYRIRQAVLAALPLGLLVQAFSTWLPAMSSGTVGGAGLPILQMAGLTVEPAGTTAALDWTHGLGLLTGMAGCAAVLGLARLGLWTLHLTKRRRWMTVCTDADVRRRTRVWMRRVGTSRGLSVGVTPQEVTPMLLPGRRPTLLVPASLTDDPDALDLAIAHECVHHHRRDDLAHLAEHVIAAVFLAHPWVHIVRRRTEQAREEACDAAVLHHSGVEKRTYAHLLLHFASPSCTAAALSLSESASSLKTRIHTMNTSTPRIPRYASVAALALCFVLAGVVGACSESPSTSTTDDADVAAAQAPDPGGKVYVSVDKEPKLIGGLQSVLQNVEYPESAKQAGHEGRVFVKFIIETDGSVSNPEVTKVMTDQEESSEAFSDAAIDAVYDAEFTPGRKDGEPVRVKMSLPVSFRLGDGG